MRLRLLAFADDAADASLTDLHDEVGDRGVSAAAGRRTPPRSSRRTGSRYALPSAVTEPTCRVILPLTVTVHAAAAASTFSLAGQTTTRSSPPCRSLVVRRCRGSARRPAALPDLAMLVELKFSASAPSRRRPRRRRRSDAAARSSSSRVRLFAFDQTGRARGATHRRCDRPASSALQRHDRRVSEAAAAARTS